MPLPPSMFSGVPQFLQQGALPPPPGQPIAGGSPGAGGPPGSPALGPQGMTPAPDDAEGVDLFQKVAQLMSGPDSEKWTLLLAGWGMGNAIEATKRFRSKPHRGNDELAQQGFPVGNPGQTGMPDVAQMARQIQPPGAGGGM